MYSRLQPLRFRSRPALFFYNRFTNIQINQGQPDMATTYDDLLTRSSAKDCNFISQVAKYWMQNPDNLAIRSIDQETNVRKDITYAEIERKSQQVADFFEKEGFKKGDTVALMLGQDPAWWFNVAGLIRQGIAIVPCSRLLTSKDLLYRINDLKIRGIVTTVELQKKVEAIQKECPSLLTCITTGNSNTNWTSLSDIFNHGSIVNKEVLTNTEDPCIYLYTSGTTGQPKAVTHHHDYPFFHWPTGRRWLKATPNDLVYNASDTGWGFTFWITAAAWSTGASLLVSPSSQKFNPQKMLKLLQEQPITIFCAAPTVLRRLVAEKNFNHYIFPNLKRIVTVGEALDETVIQQFESRGIEVAVGFGQAETPLLVGRVDENLHLSGTMGKPISPYQITILDENAKPLPPGHVGQIAVDLINGSNKGIMRGYANASEKTKAVFSSDNHYYFTGDWGKTNPDGSLIYQGRKDDMIKVRGYRVGPDEVEKAGMSHPAVAKIAVIGIPKEYRSTEIIIKAFILLKPGYENYPSFVKSLQDHIKNETAPYKYPREIECLGLEEWSKYETISGKIRRAALRERELNRLEEQAESSVLTPSI